MFYQWTRKYDTLTTKLLAEIRADRSKIIERERTVDWTYRSKHVLTFYLDMSGSQVRVHFRGRREHGKERAGGREREREREGGNVAILARVVPPFQQSPSSE